MAPLADRAEGRPERTGAWSDGRFARCGRCRAIIWLAAACSLIGERVVFELGFRRST
jgi:hypothetical protein